MKDHINFLRAASIILQKYPEANFLLIGKGLDSKNVVLQPLIQAEGLTGNFHLLGECRDISYLTAELDVAVSSSWRGEAFPNAVGEAMACEIPCVVTDVGDSALIVADTGIVVPPKDPNSLALAVMQILNMESAARRALGQAARRRVETLYSLEQVALAYEALYKKEH